MGFITGVKNIAEAAKGNGGNTRRLKLKDGDKVRGRIMGEFDPDSPHYDPKRGLSGVFIQHTSPYDYTKKAECTAAEGQCFACEQSRAAYAAGNKKEGRDWGARRRLYFNFLFEGDNGPEVAYFDVSTQKSAVYDNLVDQAGDTGSVTNMEWTLRRSGSDVTNTNYSILTSSFDSKPYDWPDVEPIDLEKLIPTIPYEDQEKFYGKPRAAAPLVEDADSETTIDW